MDNVKFSVKGDKLVIEVDISPRAIAAAGLSSTRKSMLVASTRGMARVDGPSGVSFSLNASAPVAKAA